MSLNKSVSVGGKVGVAMLPGSTHVLNRTSGTLQQCNRQLCPHADIIRVKDVETLVNRAPYLPSGIMSCVSAHAPVDQQLAAYGMLSILSSKQVAAILSIKQVAAVLSSKQVAAIMSSKQVAAWVRPGIRNLAGQC
jgi:hypothetical protein